MSKRSSGTSRIASTPPDSTLPERFGIGRAGETARHRDDRDRLVRARRHRRSRLGARLRGCLLAEPEHVAEQVVGHVGQAWVVHRQGGRHLLAHSLLDAAPQFDGHQRIHAEVEEAGLLADLRGDRLRVTSATASRR